MNAAISYGQYLALKIPTDGYVSVAETGLIVDGKHAFSIETWIYLNGMGGGISLLKKDGVFNFGISHGRLHFTFGDLDICQSSRTQKVGSEMWHHLVVTYDGAFLFLYIDGECVGKAAVMPSAIDTPSECQIGTNLDGFIRFLKVYDRSIDNYEVRESMYATTDASPCYYFDFTCNPPVDHCHPSGRIDLIGRCRMCLLEPSLCLQSTAYAEPTSSESINPGGKQIDAYTIQASILVTGNQSRQTIFVNGVHDIDAGIALYLRYESEQKGYRLCSLRGSDTNAYNKLFSNKLIPTDEWVNIAVSYDGQSSRIYINGALDAKADNVGPILLPMQQGQLLIGGMLESGKTIGYNTMQGYIRRIDIWERALSEKEIVSGASAPPSVDAEGLADSFDFTTMPFRSSKLDIPISMNDMARFNERVTTVEGNLSEPAHIRRVHIRCNPELLAKERARLDIEALEKKVVSLCTAERMDVSGSMSRILGRDCDRDEMDRAKEILSRTGEGKRDRLLAVTHYMESTDYVIVAHYAYGSEVIDRCRVDEIDDCLLRLVELLLLLIGGIISALFGIKIKSSPKAVNFICSEILSLAAIKAILAKGEAISGSDVYEFTHTLYVNGKLKPLLRIIVDLGFWNLIRFLAKAVLTFMGLGTVDTIANLTATAVTFSIGFGEYVRFCIAPPVVTLESITFNHDLTRSDNSALNLRKDHNSVVSRPEWRNGRVLNEPVAYAIAQMNAVRLKARFRMSFICPYTLQLRARADVGNPLGDTNTVSCRFFPLVSREVTFTLVNLNAANLSIEYISDLRWIWEYVDPTTGAWQTIQTTGHEVYLLNDVPTQPWNQNARNPGGWPRCDILSVSRDWLPQNGVPRNTNLAPFFVEGINACGMTYDGHPHYLSGQELNCRFNFTAFIANYSSNRNRTFVECSECAALVKFSTSLWGSTVLDVVMFWTDVRVHTSFLQAIGRQDWGTHNWAYHVIASDHLFTAIPTDNIYDCCIHMDNSNDPWHVTVPVPILPGSNANPMQLGTLTLPQISPPNPTITGYLDRLFDNNSANRAPLKYKLFSYDAIL